MDKDNNSLSFKAISELWSNSVWVSKIIWKDKALLQSVFIALLILVSVMPFAKNAALGVLLNTLVVDVQVHALSSHAIFFLSVFIIAALLIPLLYLL